MLTLVIIKHQTYFFFLTQSLFLARVQYELSFNSIHKDVNTGT